MSMIRIQPLEHMCKRVIISKLCNTLKDMDHRSAKRIIADLAREGHLLPETSQELARLVDQIREVRLMERQFKHIKQKEKEAHNSCQEITPDSDIEKSLQLIHARMRLRMERIDLNMQIMFRKSTMSYFVKL